MSMTMNWSQAKNTGFTLVEVMVTVGVVAIVASIAAPIIGDAVTKYQLEQDSRDLANTISEVRMQAVAVRRNTTLNLNQTGTSSISNFFWKMKTKSVFNYAKDADNVAITSLVFDLNGRLKNTKSASIKLCDKSQVYAKTVQINYMGNVVMGAQGSC